ncbi:MAG: hypothetical protein ABSD21_03800 [Rhizomicrobium sp.]|jgi:hypothetical protein
MKRPVAILLCVLAAAGCARLQDMDSDAFAPGNASHERFINDSKACSAEAEQMRSWELRGIAAENADKHRIFNRAYAACMKAKGYREDTSALDFWQAYDL